MPLPQTIRGVLVLAGSLEAGYQPTRAEVGDGYWGLDVPPSPWFPIVDIP